MVDFFLDWFILVFLFIFVGFDVFGLWLVVIRKMCGGFVQSKRWVVLFFCLIICVVYIEVIEDMFSLCFINVL